jgi:hypothetical protein
MVREVYSRSTDWEVSNLSWQRTPHLTTSSIAHSTAFSFEIHSLPIWRLQHAPVTVEESQALSEQESVHLQVHGLKLTVARGWEILKYIETETSQMITPSRQQRHTRENYKVRRCKQLWFMTRVNHWLTCTVVRVENCLDGVKAADGIANVVTDRCAGAIRCGIHRGLLPQPVAVECVELDVFDDGGLDIVADGQAVSYRRAGA